MDNPSREVRYTHEASHPATAPHLPLTWQAYEYHHRDKSNDWFWALGIITVGGVVAAIFLHNLLFALLILVAGVSLGLFAAREPDLVTFEISRRGIRIDDDLYPYQNLEGFWIEDYSHSTVPKLLLKSKKMFMPMIVIPIEDVEPEDVYAALLYFLPEEELHEPFAHHLMELVG